MTYLKQRNSWRMSCDIGKATEGSRMSCDVGEVTERLENEQSSFDSRRGLEF